MTALDEAALNDSVLNDAVNVPPSPQSEGIGTESATHQARFHQRWNHLNDPDVRALAWLLDAPDLFDPLAPQWCAKIATLTGVQERGTGDWLIELDRDPAALHAALNTQTMTRLGRYAEKLLAFYFLHQGILVAHGVQVRANKNETIGEFDFLLQHGDGLLHIELATKFYLFEASIGANGDSLEADTDFFVGPNLADSLGAKMHKIMGRQLNLAQHPAAQSILPQPVTKAQALVKGWLFYHDGDNPPSPLALGLSSEHCRGFWCALGEIERVYGTQFAILPRLSWLAPAKLAPAAALARQQLSDALTAHFARDAMPVMVVVLQAQDDVLIEVRRGFIVPDDWQKRAATRAKRCLQTPPIE
jgi:hypothetical protein